MTYSGAGAQDVEENVTRHWKMRWTQQKLKRLHHSRATMSMIVGVWLWNRHERRDERVRDKVVRSPVFSEGTEDPILLSLVPMIPVVIPPSTEESAGALYKILDEQVANPSAVSRVGTVSVRHPSEIQVNVNPAAWSI